jgi:exopolysaccharide biosynthesis polyprenyl glycosylphosphotransferase
LSSSVAREAGRRTGPSLLVESSDLGLVDASALPVKPSGRRPLRQLLVASDVVALVLAALVGSAIRSRLFGPTEGPQGVLRSLQVEVLYLPLFSISLAIYGAYRRPHRRVRATSFLDLGRIAHGLLLGSVLIMALSAILRRWFGFSRLGWVEVTFISLPTLVAMPFVRAGAASFPRRRGNKTSRVVVIGSGDITSSAIRRLQAVPELDVLGHVEDAEELLGRPTPGRCLGEIAELPSICRAYQVDRIIVGFTGANSKSTVEALRHIPNNIRVSVVPRLFELVTWQSHVEELYGLTVMDIPPPALGPSQRAIKRSIDVVGASVALLVLAVPFLVIAALIKLTSPGPVFFRQERTGRGGRVFRIFKFRSMVVDADDYKIDLTSDREDGLFKIAHDPRVTRLGAFLRRSSIDELPQFINVLAGDMSLVGPRPFIVSESAELHGWAARRFDVRPGMTGLWQVSGRSDLPVDELRRLDYSYVASWSLLWDLKILWHTPSSVLVGHGAY